jgi:carboxylesterase
MTMSTSPSTLVNPHLEGAPFFWEAGPVGVLLVHGFTATAAEVRPLAHQLRQAGYTVAGPLLAGHGTTPQELNQTGWRDWVRSVEVVYERLVARCSQVFLGGESMGAVLALYLASRHPEPVGILLYAPAIRLLLRPRDVIRLYLAAPVVAAVPKGGIDSAEAWQGYRVNPLRATTQLLRLDRRVRRRLHLVRQPILIVQGRKDATIDPRSGDIVRRGVGSSVCELHWMEHSSHTVILDRELDQVSAVTLEFMRRAAP